MSEAMSEAEILKDLEAFEKEPLQIGPKTVEPKQSFQEKAREAVRADEAAAASSASPPQEQPAKAQPDETKAEQKEEKPQEQSEERARDEKGRFVGKTEGKTETAPENAPEPDSRVVGHEQPEPRPADSRPPDSNYEKAKKERERQKSVLANFEEEKKREREAIRREREQLDRERQQMRQEVARGPKTDVIGYDHAGKEIYSSASLWRAALDFERDGRDDMAKMARDAIPASQRLEAQQAQQSFEAARSRIISSLVAEQPALADSNSPEYKEMAEIYHAETERARQQGRQPLYDIIPDFMPLAAEVAQLRLGIASKGDLETQLAEAKKEIQRLLGQRQVNGSSPTQQPPAEVEFKDLSTDKQLEVMDAAMSKARKQMYR